MATRTVAPRYEPNDPREIPCALKWRRVHNAVCWFDLQLAQNKELELGQTIDNAIRLYDSMLADCLVKVAQGNLQKPSFCMKKKNLNKDKFFGKDPQSG